MHRCLTWVTVCEQGADGQQDLGDGEGRAPVVLQDVQTDHTLTVDVAVIDPRPKGDLRTWKRPFHTLRAVPPQISRC